MSMKTFDTKCPYCGDWNVEIFKEERNLVASDDTMLDVYFECMDCRKRELIYSVKI